jgi:hypothetical protein
MDTFVDLPTGHSRLIADVMISIGRGESPYPTRFKALKTRKPLLRMKLWLKSPGVFSLAG